MEAQQALDDLEHLLSSVLEEDHTIDWDRLKNRSPYPISAPTRRPDEPISKEPNISDPVFRPPLNFLTRLIPPIRDREQANARARFSEARRLWLNAKEQVERCNKERAKEYVESCALHEAAKTEWLEERDKRNAAIDESRDAYMASQPESTVEYCKMVLSNSSYPDVFPSDSLVDYIEDTRTAVVDYSLPDPSALPTLKEVRYVAAREAFQETHVTEAWLNRTYDSVRVDRGCGPPRLFRIRGPRETPHPGSPTSSGRPRAASDQGNAQGRKLRQRATLSHRAWHSTRRGGFAHAQHHTSDAV